MSGRRIRTLTALMALTLALGCGAVSGGDPPTPAGQQEESKGAKPDFWVDPDSEAARQVEKWEKEGRKEDAEALRRLAEQPVAEWPPGNDPGPVVRDAVASAAKTDTTPVLVAYNIPHRDCGQYSQGGAANADEYRRYIGAFADGMKGHSAIVILEPDAVPHVVDDCTPPQYHEERYQLLEEAVGTLKENPEVRVYLDAGNPSWIKDLDKLAEPLRRSGVAEADGFALNISNFQTDEDVIAYGRKLSKTLDGEHFVIDSSRNGNGPLTGRSEAWCNPPGRALGTPPTTETGDPLVDAFLWIKRPGESDGECRGGPAAGQWWPEYALGLARNAG